MWQHPHLIDEENGILTLGKTSPATFEQQDSLAAFGNQYLQLNEEKNPFLSNQVILTQGNLEWTQHILQIKGERPQPRVKISKNRQGVDVAIGSKIIPLSPGEEKQVTLPEFSVRHRHTGSEINLTPIVNATNYGTLEIYGDDENVLLPRHSTHPKVSKIIRNYERKAEEENNVESSGKLIILHHS